MGWQLLRAKDEPGDGDLRVTLAAGIVPGPGELQASERFLRAIFDNALDAIVVADEDMRYVDANAAAVELTGYSRDELLGMRISDLFLPADQALDDSWARFRDQGRDEGQLTLRRKDGAAVVIEYRAVANFIPGLHLSVMRDITQSVRSSGDRDDALRREQDARRVAERTAALLGRLQKVNVALASALAPSGIAEAIVTTGLEALEAVAGGLAIVQGDELQLVRADGYRPGVREEWDRFPLSASLPLSDAVRERRLVLFADGAERDRAHPDLAGRAGDHALICIPVTLGEACLGGLTFSFGGPRSFSEEEIAFMHTLGELTGLSMERGRLYDAERAERERATVAQRRIQFLADASEALFASLEVEKTLRSVAELVVPALADWCSFHLLEPDGTIRAVALEHRDKERRAWAAQMQDRYPVQLDASSGVGRVLRTGVAELIAEVTDDMIAAAARSTEHEEALRSVGMRSAMVVPLTAHGRVVGALTLITDVESGRSFNEEDLDLASDLARRAGIAVENARLYQDVLAAESELRLNKALLEGQNESTLDGVLVVGADGRVLSMNKRYVEMWEPGPEAIAAGTHLALVKDKLPKIDDAERYARRIEELYAYPDAEGRDEVQLVDGRVLDRWSAPLRDAAGDLRGRAWYYRDVTLRRLAEQALEDNNRRTEFLAEATAALATTMEEQAMLAAMAEVAVEWFADWFVVDLVTGAQTIDRAVIASRDPEQVATVSRFEPLRKYPSEPTAGVGARMVIETGRTDFRTRITDDWLAKEAGHDQSYLDLLRSIGLRSYVCVPMKIRGQTIGALTFVRIRASERYATADVLIAEELAYRVASAIEHARLFRESRYVAETLQRSLLPPVIPDMPRIDISARYHPASQGTVVGGDFYDIFETAREDWAVVVGDVCGKGADAAATTALARH